MLLVEIVMLFEISPLQVNYSSEIHAKRFVTVYRIVCLGNFKRFTAWRLFSLTILRSFRIVLLVI